MAEWFTQNRYDINELSTKGLIEWAKDEVDAARHFTRVDNPERSPADMPRNARSAVEMVFNDGPAAVVMGEAELSRAAAVTALNGGRFDTVISGFDQVIRVGSERELPAGAALAAQSIQREAAAAAALNAQSQVPAHFLKVIYGMPTAYSKVIKG
jgi:ABC-type branched-subunit amino acid transport system substrate-binding protein